MKNKLETLKYFLTRNPKNIINYFDNLKHCFDFFIFNPKMQSGTIEISNICNLNCKMCETQGGTREKKHIDWETYTKAVDDFYDAGVKNISFHTINEPLLDKYIVKKLEYLNSKGMKLLLTTNGTLVDIFLEKVIEAKLTNFTIRFSIDGAKKETFENIRVGANFDKVIDNLIKTYEYKQKHHENLEISVNYCVSKETIGEIPLFIKNYSRYFDKMLFPIITGAFLKGSKNSFFKEKSFKSFLRQPCLLPFRGLWVLYNGDVSICCADNNAELVIGNIHKTSLKELWENHIIKEYRKNHLSVDAKVLPNKCKRCKLSSNIVGKESQNLIDTYIVQKKEIDKIPEELYKIIQKYDNLNGYYDL